MQTVEVHENKPEKFNPQAEVAACYLECEGKLLLLLNAAGDSEAGSWGVPAGKLESNEAPLNGGTMAYFQAKDPVRKFMQQVLKGINQALKQKGPVLIVAHGGVLWALCCFLGVECEWAINNCVPVHFTVENKKWNARRLI